MVSNNSYCGSVLEYTEKERNNVPKKRRRWRHRREKMKHVPPGSLAQRLFSTLKQGMSVGVDPATLYD